MLTPARALQRGLTLIELMVVLAIIALLTALAAPAMRTWSVNAQIRTTGSALQSNLRMAQAEAVRSFRQVVYFRTASTACDNTATASSTGTRWVIKTVPLLTNETAVVSQCGSINDNTSIITVTGPTAVCFGANGRTVAVTAPAGLGVDCTTGDSGTTRFALSAASMSSSADLKLFQVWVSPGGSVRLCDSKRLLSDTMPDGCPAINQDPTT